MAFYWNRGFIAGLQMQKRNKRYQNISISASSQYPLSISTITAKQFQYFIWFLYATTSQLFQPNNAAAKSVYVKLDCITSALVLENPFQFSPEIRSFCSLALRERRFYYFKNITSTFSDCVYWWLQILPSQMKKWAENLVFRRKSVSFFGWN